jgi:hypothetical protein
MSSSTSTEGPQTTPPNFLRSLLEYVEGHMLVVNPTKRHSSGEVLEFLKTWEKQYHIKAPKRTDSITVRASDGLVGRIFSLVSVSLSLGFALGFWFFGRGGKTDLMTQRLQDVFSFTRRLFTI